uniref:Retrotransposon gag domain-containing protein n=1 Tax=Tanacetum cinerariifolium TaxID=118510 RepID=A0A6L2KN05_TANCI|nr:hypothetical protein [Tanacetum cinerariifolium]
MRTRSSSNLPVESPPNPSTSNPKRRNRRRSKQPFIREESPLDTMADQRTMTELLCAPTEGYAEAIVVLPILAEQFELKHNIINMMTSDQFFRQEKDNPHDHIRWFNKITSTIKYKDVPNSTIKLMLFPFSLAGEARRTINLRYEISNFQQRFDESFHEAWDRYKDLLRACPHHGFTELHQLDTFYNALNPADQDSLNSAAGGNLDANSNSSFEIAKLTHAVNQQTSVVTTAMIAILKQFQVTPPPASVKAVEEIFVTCGGVHLYYQCLAAAGNTFPELRDNIQGYVAAAAVNYNQGNFGYRPPAVILKKLPKKLGDPRKFLISCGFNELKCKAIADLANRAICTPTGIARDVFVLVGKFTFPADFVIVDYESDPRVPFILGRPFLQTDRALIDVHGEEMILRDGNERLNLNIRHDTSSYSSQPQKESINLINICDDSNEDFLEELCARNFQSGNPTFSSHPKLTSPEVKNDVFNPHQVLKPFFSSPIPVEDSNSFLEKFDTSLSFPEYETFLNHTKEKIVAVPLLILITLFPVHVPNVLTTHPTLILDTDFIPSDSSLPEFETFYFDIKEKTSGSTTIHADISLLDLECFNFDFKPDPGELTSIVDSEICEKILSATNANFPPEEDHSPLFAYVVWIFIYFLTYPVVPPHLLSFGNEDTIFDLGISNYRFSSLLLNVSHRCETFIKFNVYPKLLNECPMKILSSSFSLMEQ